MNIICLVLDSLRSDKVPPECTSIMPNLASLANESVVFDNAIATGSWTVPSHASLFTGRYPSNHGATADTQTLHKCTDTTLATSLSKSGYSSTCVTTNPWLTEEFGIIDGFDRLVSLRDSPPLADTPDPREEVTSTKVSPKLLKELAAWAFSGNPARRAAKAAYVKFFQERTHPDAENVVDKLIDEADPYIDNWFIFANFMDAHEPYFDSEEREKVRWNLHSVSGEHSMPPNQIRDAYDESVRSLDQELGRYFDYLKDEQLYDESMIIVLGDHGQALGEHGYCGHGTYLYDCLIDVPLLIKPPGGTSTSQQINEPFSIRRLYDLIQEQATSDAPLTADRIDTFTESIVVAESAGPHMNCEYPDDEVDENGYRAFVSRDWRALEQRSTGELEILSNQSNKPVGDIHEEIDQLKSELDLSREDKEASVDIASSTQKQLEELGYM